jgi:MurNAc alpha-1-phosphate uridylyltransferase
MSAEIRKAMVLSAGHGKRMRPLTNAMPKPLIKVGGRSMLERQLDRLEEAGVEEVVVNLHYLGEQIEKQLAGRERPKISFSWEEEALLETGGGVKKALGHFGDEPFFVLNGDMVFLNGLTPALRRLAERWDDAEMDALLLLYPTVMLLNDIGLGDFDMDPEGRLSRRMEGHSAPFVFTGIQALHPRLFKNAPDGVFSLNRLYDEAIEAERLFGLRHDGLWYHVGTPDDLEATEDDLLNQLGEHPEPRLTTFKTVRDK